MSSRLNIVPGIGLGPIRFDMTPSEVLAILPEPEVWEDWMGGNLNDALLFRGLRLHFSDSDSRAPLPASVLEWIVIHKRDDAYLFDQPVGDWTKDTILKELISRAYRVQTPPNGSLVVPGELELGFDTESQLNWVELSPRKRNTGAVWFFAVIAIIIFLVIALL